MGQKQTLGKVRLMSALPPKADIVQFDFQPAANFAARVTVGGLDCLPISSY
jgi:hypothetical protein